LGSTLKLSNYGKVDVFTLLFCYLSYGYRDSDTNEGFLYSVQINSVASGFYAFLILYGSNLFVDVPAANDFILVQRNWKFPYACSRSWFFIVHFSEAML